ncbi:MAG: carboxypeptidase regulatory-like domain-containing protein [Planctomycetota bacterium]|nr:MAG: carboxypeptidase regulatory-like domain-containing protein [Planctomycetota bacterium]
MNRRKKPPGTSSRAARSTQGLVLAACVVLGSSAFLLTRDDVERSALQSAERVRTTEPSRATHDAELASSARREPAAVFATHPTIDGQRRSGEASLGGAEARSALPHSTRTLIRVVDGAGAAVPDAALEVWCERPAALAGVREEYIHGRSAANGEFAVEGVWNSLSAVAWHASSTAPLTELTSHVNALELVLRPAQCVRGVVRDAISGEPLAGAEICIWTHARSDIVSSAADGTFAHPRVPAIGRRQQVRTSADGYASRISFVECDALDGTRTWSAPHEPARIHGSGADARVEISLWPEARLHGRVVGPGGEPIVGARVRAEGYAALLSDAAKPCTAETRTDERGRYDLHGLRPDIAHALFVDAPPLAAQLVELPSGAEHETDFQLEPGATIQGVVLDPSGAPAEGITVLLRRMDAPKAASGGGESASTRILGRASSTTADVAGAFAFEGLGSHRYQLRVMRGPQVLLRRDVVPQPGEAIALPPLTLDIDSFTLLGAVEADSALAPVEGTRIEVRREHTLGSVLVAGDGTFRIAGLDAKEPYELRWFAADSEHMLARTTAWASETVRLHASHRAR